MYSGVNVSCSRSVLKHILITSPNISQEFFWDSTDTRGARSGQTIMEIAKEVGTTFSVKILLALGRCQ